jgi:hypothetical protein
MACKILLGSVSRTEEIVLPNSPNLSVNPLELKIRFHSLGAHLRLRKSVRRCARPSTVELPAARVFANSTAFDPATTVGVDSNWGLVRDAGDSQRANPAI